MAEAPAGENLVCVPFFSGMSLAKAMATSLSG
jgi:hypothetical protein